MGASALDKLEQILFQKQCELRDLKWLGLEDTDEAIALKEDIKQLKHKIKRAKRLGRFKY